jgi:hypothetical protein
VKHILANCSGTSWLEVDNFSKKCQRKDIGDIINQVRVMGGCELNVSEARVLVLRSQE